MKKIFLLMVIVFLGSNIFCEQKKPGTGMDWIDGDTIRVSGTGTTIFTDKPEDVRKGTACEAAVMDAESKIIKKFSEVKLSSVEGEVSMEQLDNSVIVKFKGIIRNGSIVKENFNSQKNECTVIYELKERGLREKVSKILNEN
jgi:hypothetical protein